MHHFYPVVLKLSSPDGLDKPKIGLEHHVRSTRGKHAHWRFVRDTTPVENLQGLQTQTRPHASSKWSRRFDFVPELAWGKFEHEVHIPTANARRNPHHRLLFYVTKWRPSSRAFKRQGVSTET